MATASRQLARHVVCPVADLPAGTTRIVEINGRSVGVFNDEGRLHALRNVCPHHGAPLCRGDVSGLMRASEPHVYDYSGSADGERIVRCPWHGYQFRLSDGRSVTNPERMRVRSYDIRVEGDHVVVYV
jgi:3-phenylpropionate/trans-cinnamate dioxygenase ferredoxin subunit